MYKHRRVDHSECTHTEGYSSECTNTEGYITVNVQTQRGISQ